VHRGQRRQEGGDLLYLSNKLQPRTKYQFLQIIFTWTHPIPAKIPTG
jgi:hypothetical protein